MGSVVESAKVFVTKVLELRGLSAKGSFLLLRAFSQGHVTHLLRSNHEGGDWAGQFDEALLRGLELLLDASLSLDQRAQCFLRLSDGGLGFGSARRATEAAFLGSWALAL